MSNAELVKKADWALTDLDTNGGSLEPEQAASFIRKLIVQPTILRNVRRQVMVADTMKLPKIVFAGSIMKDAASLAPVGSALAVGKRSAPTTSQVILTAKELIGEVRLNYDIIENNIELGNIGQMNEVNGTESSGGIKDTILDLIAGQVAQDQERLLLHGDTLSADDLLVNQDGILKLATSNVVDFGSASISKDLFKQGLQTLPDQYHQNLTALRHYVSVDKEIAYRDSLANRETGLGDANIQGTSPVFGYGVRVEKLPTLSLEAAGEAQGLLTDPRNIIWGIQRDIKIETDKDITTREVIIVVTMKVALALEEEEAVVKYLNVSS